MKSKSLLINYVSVPELLSCLIPDIGLALLAGILKENGHKTKIIDYSTLETIKRFVPSKKLQDKFSNILGDLELFFQENKFIDNEQLDKFDLSEYMDLVKLEKKEKDDELKKIIDEIDQEILNVNPNFVGFKLWAGECFSEVIKIAEELKRRHPDLLITGGGPEVDWSLEHIYEVTDAFDILSFGDGDESIVQIAEYSIGKRKIEDINNILYKKNGEIHFTEQKMYMDLNKLPYPDYSYETYPALKGNNKLKVFMLEESRGCPNRCNFCIHPIKSGNVWRVKEPSRIADEMDEIRKTHNSRYFRFAGSNTPTNLQTNIAKEILDRNMDVRYSSFGHIRAYRNCDYELISKAGCVSILFGLETGNTELQKKVMNKVVEIEAAEKVIKECNENGISSVVSVIYPSPLETEKTRQETINFVKRIKPTGVFTCMPFIVPRTEWFNNSEKYDIEFNSKDDHIRFMMTHHVRFNGHPILWNFGSLKINGMDFRKQGIECGKFVDEIKKLGILTQVTEEEMLFASILNEEYYDFALSYQKIRNSYDMVALEELVKKLNDNVCFVNN